MSVVLLLSGGMDSAAVAVLERPAHALNIDYGQRPARAEAAAASQIAQLLGIPLARLRIDCSTLGAGTLSSHSQGASRAAPTPEWWPYRNQLLATFAAAWAVNHGLDTVQLGAVSEDGQRHVDGTSEFYRQLNALIGIQEGGVRLRTPAISMSSAELVRISGVTDEILGWTHSCHRGNVPCGNCSGCRKRQSVLALLGRLQ